MGTLLLEGGAEFGGRMSEPDLLAISLAGGPGAPIAVLPTAAAPDRNHERAGRNGSRWFNSLGATRVDVVPVIDQRSANDPALAARVRSARLIYMLGGFPGFVVNTLAGSRVWQAALDSYADGAVLGGSSAGAMVLCEHLYDPERGQLAAGLNLVPGACVLPHHNGFGKSWAPRLSQLLPAAVLIGIDEQTGILGGPSGTWTVHGAGSVTLYSGGASHVYSPGSSFDLRDPLMDRQ
jgi:cyanophycinase